MANKRTRSSSPNIPPEIIEIILSKVSSVKSLLRFKTVCRSWNNIISDPIFIQNHLQNSPNNLFLSKYRNYSKGGFSLVKLEGPKFHDEALQENINKGRNVILCECNGVLLLSNSRDRCKEYMLWNPSTQRETYFKNPYAYNNEFCFANHGICYDSIRDDLKVVLIAKSTYAIYSCKDGSWSEKKLGTQCFGNGCSGIYVDGATYWVVLLDCNEFYTELVYFDPRVDELKTLQKPEQLPRDDDNEDLFTGLICLRGKLCLYCDVDGTRKLQIWHMEEKGIHVGQNPNWKELITFEDESTRSWCWPEPLCYVGNKILLRLGEKRFVYCSPSEKTFEYFEGTEADRRRLIPYRSSLYFPTSVKTET